jgi:polyhydroxybutyrate depolymerase
MKKWFIRLVLIFIGLPLILITLAGGAYLLANRTNGSLISSGQQRTYLLYVPKSYNPAIPTPLVISIHGHAEWPALQMEISHWNILADQFSFLVVYPSGTQFPLQWRTRGKSNSNIDPMLDVIFISDLIDKLEGQFKIDPDRIYANGLSNGGGMSFKLACQLSSRIAAIGSVSGAYLLPWEECSPSRPVPAVIFHGTADPIVPYQGGPSFMFNIPFPVIPEWVDTFADLNGCDPTPQNLMAMGDVSSVQYNHCKADLVFYTISGGGHAWPGGTPLPEFLVSHTTQSIDATRIMWDFFQQHPRNSPSS